MPREDDPRFGPGGQYAAKPGGVDYAPPPQLTLEAARNFEAYDRAQAWTSAHPSPGRALEPWETEDRITYNRARQEIARRMAPAAPLLRNTQYYNLAGQAQMQEEALRRPQAVPLPQATQQFAPRDRGGFTLGSVAQGAYDVARTSIPYADRVAEAAGQAGTYAGSALAKQLMGPLGQAEGALPERFRPSELAGKAGGFVAEALIPTEVWQVALTLLPAAKARSIPELLSAITIGDKDALTAIKKLKPNLSEREIVNSARQALAGGERGALTLGPGDEAAKAAAGAGEAASSSLPADVLPLPSKLLREAFSGKHGRVQVGTRVFATDRNNFGRVVQINPDGTAKVYFKSPQGGEAYVDLPADVLNPLVSGGRRTGTKVVPLTNAELTQSWELLPAENQKFVGVVAEHSLTETRRAELLKASRTRKAANIADISRGEGSANEKLAQMWAARRGADLPEQPALREFFDDTDIASYERQIIDAVDSQLVTPHEATNAGSILKLIMDGARRDGTKTPITQGERSLMGKIFGPELEKVLPTTPTKMSLLQKFLAPFQLHRALRTALDLGAMFRQGRKVIFSDFHEWARASRTQFRVLGQQGYERVQEVVHSSPYYSLGQSTERPLGIMELGGGLSDEFLSPLTKPSTGTGIRKLGSDILLAPIRVSERTYNGFLNMLRQGIFDKNMDELVKAAGSLDQVPMSEVQRIIDNINTATMFGNISALGDYSKAISQTLFSVRSLVSGPQFYGDFVRALGPDASPAARKIIVRRFASVIASDLATLGSVAAVGAYLKAEGSPIPVSVNMDPWSQSLGDVQVGPVKWNIWGPEVQMVRATLQAATGKRRPEGASETQSINAFERGKGYGRTKLSPTASVFYDLFLNKQRDFQGRPIGDRAWQYAVEQAAPIMGPSMYEAFRENGFWGAAGAGQSVGLDVQVYGPTKSVQEAEAKATAFKPLNKVGFQDIVPDTWRDNLPKLRSITGLSKPIDQFANIEDAKADYLAPTPGGTIPTRSQIEKRAAQFDALPAVKTYKEMIKKREVYVLRKVPLTDRQAAYDARMIDLDAEQRAAVGIK